MRVLSVLIIVALFTVASANAQQVFDSHVHLWSGEKSLREYQAQVQTDGIEEVGFGGMWFGGPNRALRGHPKQIAASNDAQIA